MLLPDQVAGNLGKRIHQLEAILSSQYGIRPDQTRLAEAVLRLQRGLTGERRLICRQEAAQAGQQLSYMEEKDLLAAYLSYYWPVSYTQVSYILHTLSLGGRRILDLGSGPGPMSAAILDWINCGAAPKDVRPELTLIDSSPKALKLAELILKQEPAGSNTTPAGLTLLTARLEAATLPAGPYDLIVFGHSLNELATGQEDWLEQRLELLKQAASRLADRGCLILIEPALLKTARNLIQLRDIILEQASDFKLQLLGPCTSPIACPAFAQGENQTCHEEFQWRMPAMVARLAEQAGLERQRVKMAWFAFRRTSGDQRACAQRASDHQSGNRRASHQEASDRVETIQADNGKKAYRYRVVSEPILNKAGRVRYLLCGAAGRFAFSAKNDDRTAKAAGFFDLSRGDYLKISHPELRENGWGVQPATRIERLEATRTRPEA